MLRIRFATASDAQALEEFYRRDPSPFVELRKPGLVARRVEERGAILLSRGSPDAIVGATLTYLLDGGRHVEFGSTRTIGIRGFPLYEILLSFQALAAVHAPHPELWPIADVDVDNPSVIRRLTGGLGFQQIPPPLELIAENLHSIIARRTEVVWLRCPAWSLGIHAALIGDIVRSGQVTDLRGRSVPILIDSSISHLAESTGLAAIRSASDEMQHAGIAAWSELRRRVFRCHA